MKNYILLIITLLSVFSCKKAIECQPNCAGKRILFLESGGKINRYTYDKQNRQIFITIGKDTVSKTTYKNNFAEITQLNSTVEYITDDKMVAGQTLATYSRNKQTGIQVDFEYDKEGHLIKAIQYKPGVINDLISISNNTWLNGNLIKNELSFGINTPIIVTYEQESSVINSTGNEFKGLAMFGKTSVNALKSITSNNLISNISYETDDCGCITKSISKGSNTTIEQNFTYELIN